ncbi:hypothetical protein MTQ93_09635 [Staphylococcus agnetis]|uniref:hypothetical protein n=1 Tax=Staphylococcus agnetis TaxID=985762 RepID=UPI00208F81C6|nr:hypothetical protein [Staphylococcus agnetis]MCO4346305.1 hypothetical protein [Staphylococcus agnetis]MCO4360619.1 hypothetical protein [Staphylococcus agnetis]
MKKSKITTLALTTLLILTGCGKQETAKVDLEEKNKNAEDKKELSHESKAKGDKEESVKENVPDNKLSANELLRAHDKADVRDSNAIEELPEKYQTKEVLYFAESTLGYHRMKSEEDGKKRDVTDAIRQNVIEEPNEGMDYKLYPKVEASLKEAYGAISELRKKTKDYSKYQDERKKVIDKYFMKQEKGFEKLYAFSSNEWQPDFKTLAVTHVDKKDVSQWQVSFKNKEGKKVGTYAGYFYHNVDMIQLKDGGATNSGLIEGYQIMEKDYTQGRKEK